MNVRRLPFLLLIPLAGLAVPHAIGAPPAGSRPTALVEPQGKGVKALQAEINAKLNKTPREVFEKLGKIRTKSAFQVLKTSAQKLKGRQAKIRAFAAMRHLLDDEKLKDPVLEHIEDVAINGSSGNAQAAVRGLAQFGQRGKVGLRRIVEESDDVRTRQFAFRPIHKELLSEGGTKVRDMVLRDFLVPESGSEDQALALLRMYTSPADLKLFKAVVEDEERSISMRRIVIRAMESLAPKGAGDSEVRPKKGDQAAAVIMVGLKSDEPRLQYQALLSTGLRPAPMSGAAMRVINKHAKSDDDATRRAATLLLLEKGDGKLTPLKLAGSRDVMMRQAAAIALGSVPGDQSFKALAKLATDKNWTVKVEAIRALSAQRDRRAIPLLVERIHREQGRLIADVAAALEGLTGRTYGTSVKTWRRFWNKEGDEFEMPTLAQATEALEARAKKKNKAAAAAGASVASFYGLSVISGRFAIVFDASLSMQAKGKSGKRRIETAKEQLKSTINRLGEGTLLNLIPFAAKVDPLWDRLMPLNEETQAEAIEFTDGLIMKLGTDIYDGLFTAFLDEQIDTIYVLSDGASTEGVVKDTDGLQEEVSRWNSVRGIRIHCIAIGTNHPLLRGLAADSGGTFVRVD